MRLPVRNNKSWCFRIKREAIETNLAPLLILYMSAANGDEDIAHRLHQLRKRVKEDGRRRSKARRERFYLDPEGMKQDVHSEGNEARRALNFIH